MEFHQIRLTGTKACLGFCPARILEWRVIFLIIGLVAGGIGPDSVAAVRGSQRQESDSTTDGPAGDHQSNDDPFERGRDTQEESIPLLNDQQALQSFQVPRGFQLSLFASAPQVAQPIAATFDHRGRLWVAENYTYSERPDIFQRDKNDRIVVLEDVDGDGAMDQSSVFWQEGKLLSSLEVGMGGVWALCPPQLLFLPDADRDAVIDGPPQVILDGFDDQEVGHNMVNGLRWGPDGWLYGRHGIQATSHVGKPGTDRDKRVALNCCIWRYHPLAEKFEVVCQGTTNSWGHDWTAEGELFFINTVIGHLWHAIPNSHFERMYGEDLTPHTFELTGQVADHVHWDDSQEAWQDVQKATSSATDRAGGGHAHSGMLIVQQPDWPAEWQDSVLTVNYHGRRLNRDQLRRQGATYVAEHRPDLLSTEDPWFRGIDLIHGPGQSVMLLDWQDIGECHENDGVHRSSGRIYRLQPDTGEWTVPDWEQLDSQQWVALLTGPHVFAGRQARQLLQTDTFCPTSRQLSTLATRKAVVLALRQLLESEDPQRVVRAMWGLQAMGGIGISGYRDLLAHSSPLVRRWAVRSLSEGVFYDGNLPSKGLVENTPDLTLPILPSPIVGDLQRRAEVENDPLVLCYLASSMRRMTVSDRWKMGQRLATHGEMAGDRVFPLLVWYGLEPAILAHADQVDSWLSHCRLEKLNRFVARRLAVQYTIDPDCLSPLLETMAATDRTDSERLATLMAGLAEGWDGWTSLPVPNNWDRVVQRLESFPEDSPQKQLFQSVAGVFRTDLPLDQLITIVHDTEKSLIVRGSALESIGRRLEAPEAEDPSTLSGVKTLEQFLGDRFLAPAAVRGIAFHRAWIPKLLEHYGSLRPEIRQQVLQVCVESPISARELLRQVASQAISSDDLSPYLLRQLQLLGDPGVQSQVAAIWPERQVFGADQLAKIEQWKSQLDASALTTADPRAGAAIFQDQCGKCHRLFGEGGTVGPELTGAQRSNLTYWLQNVLAPSAEVGTGFRMSVVQLQDGRVLSGVVTERTPASFRLITQTDSILVRTQEVDAIRQSELSLMPDGILESLERQQVIDLLGYLMSPTRP